MSKPDSKRDLNKLKELRSSSELSLQHSNYDKDLNSNADTIKNSSKNIGILQGEIKRPKNENSQ